MGRKKKQKSFLDLLIGSKPKPKVRKRRSHMVKKKDIHGEVSYVRI